MPSISVHIVTYDSEKEIETCLESIFNQSIIIDTVLVIDNNSKDTTLSLLSKYKDVKVIRNEVNNGFAGAHNQGINITETDYVLVLNPDVILDRNYIKNIIERLEADTNLGMATGKLYRDIDKKIIDSCGLAMKKNRRAVDRGSNLLDTGQYNQVENIFGVSGAAAVYRRKMILDISFNNEFFDASFFAYKEDIDVSWRAQILGWKGIYVPDALAQHGRGWKEDKKRTDIPLKIRQNSYINRYFYIMKNDNLLYFILHFPFIIIYEILSFTYAIFREKEVLKSWDLFRKQYSKMRVKRAEITKRQKASNKEIYSWFKGIW